MDFSYDEDLGENEFFKALQRDHGELFEKATLEGWVLCVPRAGCLAKSLFNQDDFFAHILVPSDELPETHFSTLNGKDVRISNMVITVEPNNTTPYITHVLFEETYYTEDMLKYKVLCVESPLEQYSSEDMAPESSLTNVQTLRDCIDLLWTQGSKDVLEAIDDNIQTFLNNNEGFEKKGVEAQRELVGFVYKQCLQRVLRSPKLRERSLDRHLLDNIRLSVEALVQHGLYKNIMRGISAETMEEDAKLNKITRNLSEIGLEELGIRAELRGSVPRARAELGRLERYSTVLGKVGCLRRTVEAISGGGGEGGPIAADDLLPMLVFLTLKSAVPNWTAQLTFIAQFSYANTKCHYDRHSFLVTSLEAAIEHLRNGLVTPKRECPTGGLLRAVWEGEREAVVRMLEDRREAEIEVSRLCHPLCRCETCDEEVERGRGGATWEGGLTSLHLAASRGHTIIVELLLDRGAMTEVFDERGRSPAHLAARYGHQTALLVLCERGADLGARDNQGDTPLHLASRYSHFPCVKALLYFAETKPNAAGLQVNAVNSAGDTPLDCATYWGYSSIVSLLLEYSARPRLERVGRPPLDLEEVPRPRNGLRPASALQIRKVERLFSAIAHGDTRLAAFYLGIDHTPKPPCHPLCSCNKLDKTQGNPYCGEREGLDVNVCDLDGQTALHVASLYGRSDFVKILVDAGAQVNLITRHTGVSPLHVACENDHAKIAETLLWAGADIGCIDAAGDTPLHVAARRASPKLLRILLSHRPSLDAVNHAGRTPIEEAKLSMSLSSLHILTGHS